MPIKIDFVSNVRDLIRGTEDTEKALDDVADSLDDMTKAAKKGGDDAERAVEDLGDSFRDAARRAKDLEDAGKDAGRGVKRGMETAEDGVSEFKDEANSTARESAASFDGSAESIADAFQEIAANAFAGFGPAGALAGLAAAAGIGLAVAGFEAMNEAEEESRKRAADWADAYIVAGGRILTASQQVEKARAIITDPEQFKQAQENAKDWGVTEGTAILAMAGNADALAEAERRLGEQTEANASILERRGGDRRRLTNEERELREAVQDGTEALRILNGDLDAGAQQADVYSESLRLLAANTEGATMTVDEFGDTVYTLPDGKQIYIDAETGKATEDTEAIGNKIYGLPDSHNTDITATTSNALNAAQYAVDRISNMTATIKIRADAYEAIRTVQNLEWQ